ncbi:spore germination protein [Cytobacillus suaedae]|nr:spore germination protein [Cytobacillus suaedae]
MSEFLNEQSSGQENNGETETTAINPKDTLYPTINHIINEFQDCGDLVHRTYPQNNVDVFYFDHLVDFKKLKQSVLNPCSTFTLEQIQTLLNERQYLPVSESKKAITEILDGKALLFFNDEPYIVDIYGPKERAIVQSESETVITGPHDALVEGSGTNLSIIRRRVKSSHLKVLKFTVGEVAKTDVYLLYIKEIANPDLIHQLIERIKGVEVDAIHDTNMMVQMIDENPNSIFPQYLTTERPDTVASKLIAGRIVGIIDGSPSAFIAPTSFFEFFASPDDYYQRWWIGSFIRVLRFFAFIITILFTSLYVSATTYHYEIIPDTLLISLAESRSRVPFPPIYEALLLEVTIELLREAGARLPTKIGQTIGIVGGIVIGQAAVDAGFTSNILIIAVAISAIASFVIPSYIMSASIRLIRFGLIILAGIWGNFGIVVGIAFIIIHLSGVTNVGTSYVTPLAPFYKKDWLDTFVRGPLWALQKRPVQSISPNMKRNKMRR